MADNKLVYHGNYNPAKIINLSVMNTNNSSYNTDELRSWRFNVSRLLGNTESMNTGEENTSEDKGFFSGDFYKNTDVDKNVQLLLEDPIPDKALATSNKMNYPIGGVINGAADAAKGAIGSVLGLFGVKDTKAATNSLLSAANIAANAFSSKNDTAGGTGFIFDPWIKNAPAWEGTGGNNSLAFDYTFKFRLGQYKLWNAKEEVVKPVANLVLPTMLRKIGSARMFGPFPTPGALLQKITSGDEDAYDANTTREEIDSKLEQLALKITNAVGSGYSDYLYTLQIGPLRYEWVAIENSVVEWSPETDQYGYPIAATAKLSFTVPIAPALKYGPSVPNAVSMKFKSGSEA